MSASSVRRNATNNAYADYERVGVVDTATAVATTPVESAKELEELRDLLHHLEDRHVGLRHELLTDFEALQDDVEELRDDAAGTAADIDGLEETVAGLRREVAELRQSAERRMGNNNHEQWRRQQVLDRLATEGK